MTIGYRISDLVPYSGTPSLGNIKVEIDYVIGSAGYSYQLTGTQLAATILYNPTIGSAGAILSAATSGAVTITANNTTTSYTLKLPTTAGTANYYLKTDGAGNTDWVLIGGGNTTVIPTNYVPFGNGTYNLSYDAGLTYVDTNAGSATAITLNLGNGSVNNSAVLLQAYPPSGSSKQSGFSIDNKLTLNYSTLWGPYLFYGNNSYWTTHVFRVNGNNALTINGNKAISNGVQSTNAGAGLTGQLLMSNSSSSSWTWSYPYLSNCSDVYLYSSTQISTPSPGSGESFLRYSAAQNLWIPSPNTAQIYSVAAAPGTYDTRPNGSLWINTTSGTVSPRLYAAIGSAADLSYRQINDGAVHQYSLNETSGTTAIDAGSSPANGTYVNSPTLGQPSLTARTGSPFYSVYLTGSSYVQLPFVDAPGVSGGSWSIECVVNISSGNFLWANGNTYISGYGMTLQITGFLTGTSTGFYGISMPSYQSGASIQGLGTYHIVVTFGSGVLSMYLNADLIQSTSVTGTPNLGTNNFCIGNNLGNFGSTTTGYYQDFAFYNYPLSLAQINQHYALLHQQESTLVALH
jgi:hypothetical protein